MTGSSGRTNQHQALSTTEAESRAGPWLRLFLFPGSEPGQTSNSTEVFSLKTPPTDRKSQQGSSNHGSLWLFERQPLFARHQIASCSNNKKNESVKYPAECVTFDPAGKGRGAGGVADVTTPSLEPISSQSDIIQCRERTPPCSIATHISLSLCLPV